MLFGQRNFRIGGRINKSLVDKPELCPEDPPEDLFDTVISIESVFIVFHPSCKVLFFQL